MSKKDETSKKGLDPNVIAAIITVVGGIVTTLIITLAPRLSAPQPTPIPPTAVEYTHTAQPPTDAPTATVPAGEPSSTAAPDTPTPQPIPTATLIPVGFDWTQDCISSLWLPYPSEIATGSDDIGCLKYPVGKFYTDNGKLGFAVDERFPSAKIFGLFTKLPSDGTVDISVQLQSVVNGQVLIGIFTSPDATSSGAMLVIPESNNVKKKQNMIWKVMPDQSIYAQSNPILEADPPIYNAHFVFNAGTIDVKVKDKQIPLGSISAPSGEKWLFLGYQVFNGTNKIQAEFLNLSIK